MLRRNLLIALVLVLVVVVSLGAFDGGSFKVPAGAETKANAAASRDLLWINALLHTCEDPDLVPDVAGEATAQGIVDRGGSGQGVRQLFVFMCFRMLRELAGQEKGMLFGPVPPVLPPGCEPTIEAARVASTNKPGGPFILCSR